jgi:predicted RNA-binding protein YlqC (UPF0109 family)
MRETGATDPRDVPVYHLLHKMICLLVDYPGELAIEAQAEDEGVTFLIGAHPEDVGKIIGAQGRNAKSLRTIVSGIGSKMHRRFTLVIEDGGTGTRPSS